MGVEGTDHVSEQRYLQGQIDSWKVQIWKVWASYLFPSLSRERLTVKVPEVFYFEFALKVTDLDIC